MKIEPYRGLYHELDAYPPYNEIGPALRCLTISLTKRITTTGKFTKRHVKALIESRKVRERGKVLFHKRRSCAESPCVGFGVSKVGFWNNGFRGKGTLDCERDGYHKYSSNNQAEQTIFKHLFLLLVQTVIIFSETRPLQEAGFQTL